MKIVLAGPRGFCAGVRMAVDVVDQVLEVFPGETIYVYHEIVHNRHVVDRFRTRGVIFVEDVQDVPEGAIVVFSAHGVSPQVREQARERGLHAIDATCPLVTKVHSEAIRYARQGYQILLVGHRNHQEIIGTRGEAPDATQVVEKPEDIPNLIIRDPERLVYLTQTTLSIDDAEIIISALKKAFPAIKAPPSSDICYATTNRQHAVRSLAPGCDVVLVIGSQNSSNSTRLVEIAESEGAEAHLVDDASDIQWEWLDRDDTAALAVLVTAGASAPEDLVAGVCRALLERYAGTIEQRDVFEEDIEFALPARLRRDMAERGIESDYRASDLSAPAPGAYGAQTVTISAHRKP